MGEKVVNKGGGFDPPRKSGMHICITSIIYSTWCATKLIFIILVALMNCVVVFLQLDLILMFVDYHRIAILRNNIGTM